MAESDTHPTAGRRRRDKGPPSMPTLPRLERVSDTEGEHSEDSAGEKRSEEAEIQNQLHQCLPQGDYPTTTMQ